MCAKQCIETVQVRFERGTIATPELLQDIELPSSISVLGQPVDLTNLKACPASSLKRRHWCPKQSEMMLCLSLYCRAARQLSLL